MMRPTGYEDPEPYAFPDRQWAVGDTSRQESATPGWQAGFLERHQTVTDGIWQCQHFP